MRATRSDIFFSSSDGLRLHAIEHRPARETSRLPVVCLPGLTRPAADFEELAALLAGDARAPRRVIALDYRGRWGSDFDPDPRNYSPPVELGDLMTLLVVAGIGRAAFVGTSRGGVLAMALSASRPGVLGGIVLNDVGPIIELAGVLRIKAYVGRLPQPESWERAGELLKQASAGQFPAFAPGDWLRVARGTWREGADGRLELGFDPRLSDGLADVAADTPVPPLWHLFAGVAKVPLMVVRGENSDILARETVARMRATRPDLVAVEVADHGHAPMPTHPDVVAALLPFLDRCDTAG